MSAPETNHANLSDEDLMADVQAGDEQGLAGLYDRFGGLVFTIASSILGADADAEEVTEDVFLKVWNDAARFDRGRGTLKSWLATMTRSRAIDVVRSRRRRAAMQDRAAEAEGAEVAMGNPANEGADKRVERIELRDSLNRALAQLNPDQRAAIELAYFSGLSQSEIASRLGEPLGTVKTRMRDGMKRLRDGLGPVREARA